MIELSKVSIFRVLEFNNNEVIGIDGDNIIKRLKNELNLPRLRAKSISSRLFVKNTILKT